MSCPGASGASAASGRRAGSPRRGTTHRARRGFPRARVANHPPAHRRGADLRPDRRCPAVSDFRRIRDLVADRVDRVPPFRQRMVEVPFGLQHAAMVDDPDFDIDYHVRRVSLPPPGGRAELETLVADLASRPLDRRRPLWEFHVVEGLEGGRFALVPKVHHAIIDGVSGAEVMAVFFDLSPDPSPAPAVRGRSRRRAAVEDRAGQRDPTWLASDAQAARWTRVVARPAARANSTSGATCWVTRSARSCSRRWFARSRRTVQTARGLNGRQPRGQARFRRSPFEAPQTSINRAISRPHRRVAFAELPLADVRRIRRVLGGTANDVVLAVDGGGHAGVLRRPGRGRNPNVVGGAGAGVGAHRGGTGFPRQPGVGHAGLAGRWCRRSGGAPAATSGTGWGAARRTRAGRWGPEVFSSWAQAARSRGGHPVVSVW